MNSHRFKSVPLTVVAFIFLGLQLQAQQPAIGKLGFKPLQRVIAHGDEFNDVALSADHKRLFIASERGDVIVWNIAQRRVEKRLNQGQPVHYVGALADPQYIVAAGSVHFGGQKAVVRKWDVETGEVTDLRGLDCDFFVSALAVERAGNLVAAAAPNGCIVVWDTTTNSVRASWEIKQAPVALAIVGDTVYVSSADRKDLQSDVANCILSTFKIGSQRNTPSSVAKQAGIIITHFAPTPDKRRMAVSLYDSRGRERTALLDLVGMKVGEPFEGSAATWINDNNLLLYEWLDPARIVTVDRIGQIQVAQKFEHAMVKDEHGRAFNLTGQVALPDGSLAWSVYDKGAELIEWDLKAHLGKKLISEHVGAYQLSVLPGANSDGLVLTGGADGYVRLWNFSNLTLRREYKIGEDAVVVDAQLFPDGRRALVGSFSYSQATTFKQGRAGPPATTVSILNLESGEQKIVLKDKDSWAHTQLVGHDILYPELDRLVLVSADAAVIREFVIGKPFRRYAVSRDQNWLAVLASEGELHLFEIATGKVSNRTKTKLEGESVVAAGNEGRFVYAVSRENVLTRWDTRTGEIKETPLEKLSEMHDHSDFITLSADGQRLVVCGSHSDLAILDPNTGAECFYDRISAGVWYVEKAWLSGDLLILTTDTGVMYLGKLETSP